MKYGILFYILCFYFCHISNAQESNPVEHTPIEKLTSFLDTIHKHDISHLEYAIRHKVDSILKNQKTINDTILSSDYEILKKAYLTKKIPITIAKRIFKDISFTDDYTECYFEWFSFNKASNLSHQYAIVPHNSSLIYFFEGNKIVAIHEKLPIKAYHTDPIQYYIDATGHTVIYYTQKLDAGSGIWWYQRYFYRYTHKTLQPLCHQIEEINSIALWDIRQRHFSTTITNTTPLTLRATYTQEFLDSDYNTVFSIKDTSDITYTWDDINLKLTPQFSNPELNSSRMTSYYLGNTDFLFIYTHIDILKKALHHGHSRQTILSYLETVKNNTLHTSP